MKKLILLTMMMGVIGCSNVGKYEYPSDKVTTFEFNKAGDFVTYDIVTERIKESDFIALGEIHHTTMNNEFQLATIEYLLENWDLKYLILEVTEGQAYFLNKYIQNKDEKYLAYLGYGNIHKRFPTLRTKERMEYIKELSKLYDKYKFEVVGFDPIKNPAYSTQIMYIAEVLKDMKLPKDLINSVEFIISFSDGLKEDILLGDSNGIRYSYVMPLLKLREEIKKYEDKINKEEYEKIDDLLYASLLYYDKEIVEYYNPEEKNGYFLDNRENYLTKKLINFRENNEKKMLAIFGGSHITNEFGMFNNYNKIYPSNKDLYIYPRYFNSESLGIDLKSFEVNYDQEYPDLKKRKKRYRGWIGQYKAKQKYIEVEFDGSKANTPVKNFNLKVSQEDVKYPTENKYYSNGNIRYEYVKEGNEESMTWYDTEGRIDYQLGRKDKKNHGKLVINYEGKPLMDSEYIDGDYEYGIFYYLEGGKIMEYKSIDDISFSYKDWDKKGKLLYEIVENKY